MSNLTGTPARLAGQAAGFCCVASASRFECHAPSGFTVRDYSGKPAANGVAPRDRQRDIILRFWESQGVARVVRGEWFARDMVNGGDAWLPLAGREDSGRADVVEFSHVVSARNGGAWCAGNLLPEVGAVNAARGDTSMDYNALPMGARAVLTAWPAWWLANVARPASLARL